MRERVVAVMRPQNFRREDVGRMLDGPIVCCLALPGARFQRTVCRITSRRPRPRRTASRHIVHGGTVADHGGYAWVSSADGIHSNGEGVAGPDRIWVQPPGTPAIGLALLDAYHATGDQIHLQAAQAAGHALVQGQLRSGGWGYSIEFEPPLRKSIPYRVEPQGGREKIAPTPAPGGWDVWRERKFKTNQTLIDDDTTPAAIRFLARLGPNASIQRRCGP